MARKPPARAERGEPSWLTDYTARQRAERQQMQTLIDQLTHTATDVRLHWTGDGWVVRRRDADGLDVARGGKTLMDALNAAVPAYRRARAAADAQAKGA